MLLTPLWAQDSPQQQRIVVTNRRNAEVEKPSLGPLSSWPGNTSGMKEGLVSYCQATGLNHARFSFQQQVIATPLQAPRWLV